MCFINRAFEAPATKTIKIHSLGINLGFRSGSPASECLFDHDSRRSALPSHERALHVLVLVCLPSKELNHMPLSFEARVKAVLKLPPSILLVIEPM